MAEKYLNDISKKNFDKNFLLENVGNNRKGDIFRLLKGRRRVQYPSSYKKLKFEKSESEDPNVPKIQAEIVNKDDEENVVSDIQETLPNTSDDKYEKLWKSLFSTNNQNLPTSSASNIFEDSPPEELEIPSDARSIIENNLSPKLFNEVCELRRSSAISSEIIKAVSQVIAQNIVDQKKIVKRDAIVGYAHDFLNASKLGIDKRPFTSKYARDRNEGD
uniref:Uncharacterized protein n=1 Tax=Panagrolaimus superbus TaxID=310955 RepID=A0A914ZAE9_9BILA